jgi:phage head maturation protease
MTTTTQIPSEAYEFRSSDLKVEEKTFTLTPYKLGQVVEHFYWGKFVFEAASMRMAKGAIPALVDHDTLRGCGKIDAMTIGDDVEFSGKFVENEHSKYVQDMRDVGMECSLRFDPSKTIIEEVLEGSSVEVDGFTHEGPIVVFKEALIKEVSFTLFGHVPDTQTKFKQTAPTVTEESAMADQVPNTAELEQSAIKSVNDKLAQFNAMCDDKSFVMACFSEGMDLPVFTQKVLEKKNEEIASLSEKITSLESKITELKDKKPEGVQFSAEEPDKPQEDTFLSLRDKYVEKGMSITDASIAAFKENPELHAKFVEGDK